MLKSDEWQNFNVAQGILIYRGKVLLVGNDYGRKALVWSLPGGRLEPGEQHPGALTREFREETGLEIRPGWLAYVVDARSERDRRHYVSCVFRVELAGASEADPVINCTGDPSVKEARFVSFEEAATGLLRPSLGEPLVNYLYFGEGISRRYWRYAEYLREDWKPLKWPPSPDIQAE